MWRFCVEELEKAVMRELGCKAAMKREKEPQPHLYECQFG